MFLTSTKKFEQKTHSKLPTIIYKEIQQAVTGPSRRHIQGSKIAKRLPSVKYSFTVLENRKFYEKKIFEKITQKMDRVARRGPLARAPGALKSHNAEKLKGGPFGVFQHPF